jgi:hypothetical protein
MTEFQCALCGAGVPIIKPSGAKNHFCSRSHNDEYHNNIKLSKAAINVLKAIEDRPVTLPYTHTVYSLAHKREYPLIYQDEHDYYHLTETGRKFLKLVVDKI